jgi:hypothetical protein
MKNQSPRHLFSARKESCGHARGISGARQTWIQAPTSAAERSFQTGPRAQRLAEQSPVLAKEEGSSGKNLLLPLPELEKYKQRCKEKN